MSMTDLKAEYGYIQANKVETVTNVAIGWKTLYVSKFDFSFWKRYTALKMLANTGWKPFSARLSGGDLSIT